MCLGYLRNIKASGLAGDEVNVHGIVCCGERDVA